MGQDITSWSHTLKYLRVVFKSARTVITDVGATVRKFYVSAKCNSKPCNVCFRDVKVIFGGDILSTSVKLLL